MLLESIVFHFSQVDVTSHGMTSHDKDQVKSRVFPRFQFLSLDNEEGGEERRGFLSNLKRVTKDSGTRSDFYYNKYYII